MRPNLQNFKLLTSAHALAVCLSVLIFFMAQVDSIRPLYAQWDKQAHFLCFLGAWWMFRTALPAGQGVSFVLAVSLGGLIEIYQISRPQFHPSWFDFLADLAGAGFAWVTSLVFTALRERH